MSLLDKDKVWLLCLSHFFCWRSHLMKANFLLLCTALKKEFIFSDTALPSFAFHTQLGDKRRHKMLLLWWNSSVVSNVFHYHTSHANRPKWDFTFLKDRFRSTRSAGISAKIEISLLQSNLIPDKSQSAVVNGGLPEKDISTQPFCPAVLPEKDLSTKPFHLHASVPVHSGVMSWENINSWFPAKPHGHSTAETHRKKQCHKLLLFLNKRKKTKNNTIQYLFIPFFSIKKSWLRFLAWGTSQLIDSAQSCTVCRCNNLVTSQGICFLYRIKMLWHDNPSEVSWLFTPTRLHCCTGKIWHSGIKLSNKSDLFSCHAICHFISISVQTVHILVIQFILKGFTNSNFMVFFSCPSTTTKKMSS